MSETNPERLGELLSSYLDGELDAEQTDHVERILSGDADARTLLQDLRRTVDLVTCQELKTVVNRGILLLAIEPGLAVPFDRR